VDIPDLSQLKVSTYNFELSRLTLDTKRELIHAENAANKKAAFPAALSFYCCKNATILSRSSLVNNARVCMCIPTVFHCSGENVLGSGALWQRRQFSPHSWAPVLEVTASLTLQPVIVTAEAIPRSPIIIKVSFLLNIAFIFLYFRIELKIERTKCSERF
jgi:hypothetical protein